MKTVAIIEGGQFEWIGTLAELIEANAHDVELVEALRAFDGDAVRVVELDLGAGGITRIVRVDDDNDEVTP